MPVTAYGLDMTRARTLSVADTAVQTSGHPGVSSLLSLTLDVTGTITISFEISGDRGTTWQAISGLPSNSTTTATSATADGTWTFSVLANQLFRARCSSVSGGSAIVDMTIGDG